MAFDNILNAIKSPETSKLTPAQELENYSAFSDLQKQGVYLPDLMAKVKEVDELRKRIDEIDKAKPSVDAELFAVMEQAVRSDPAVRDARQKVMDEKTRVIMELCRQDEGFRRASDEYRRAVNAAYVRSKEAPDGE